MKILFVVLGVLAVLGFLFFGALWYGWHKVKETAKSNGIDVDGITETQHGPARRLNACDLLSKDELSQIVGFKIDRTEGTGTGTDSKCSYFSEGAIDHSTDAVTEAMKRIQENKDSGNAPADQEKAMKEVGTIMRGMAGSQANGMVVQTEVVTENPKGAMAAYKIAMGLMTMGARDADQKTVKMLKEDIKGVGDEAMMGPLGVMFMFRKGNVAVMQDGRGLTGGRDMQIAIGKKIAERI